MNEDLLRFIETNIILNIDTLSNIHKDYTSIWRYYDRTGWLKKRIRNHRTIAKRKTKAITRTFVLYNIIGVVRW